jgi:hypothetical protein
MNFFISFVFRRSQPQNALNSDHIKLAEIEQGIGFKTLVISDNCLAVCSSPQKLGFQQTCTSSELLCQA